MPIGKSLGPMTSKPIITFVLIHGTFGRDTPWVNDQSDGSFIDQLRKHLEPKFEVRFDVINWGEKRWVRKLLFDNTLQKRFAGASRLANYLENGEDVDGTNRRYLIAHSHGGSVAMYAMKSKSVHSKVSGIVCMSSPFLKYETATFHRDLLTLSAIILILISIAKGGFLLWAYTIVYVAIVLSVLVTHKSDSSEIDLIESGDRQEKGVASQFQRVALPHKGDLRNQESMIPFFAIRPHRDEVAILLWITRWAGRSFRAIWQFLNVVFRWGLYGYFLLRGTQALIAQLELGLDVEWIDVFLQQVDQKFMTPVAIVGTAVLLGMVVMRWSYAFDSLPWLTRLDPRPKIVPWEGADAIAVDAFSWPRHSGIQPQSPPEVAKWIHNDHKIDPDEKLVARW